MTKSIKERFVKVLDRNFDYAEEESPKEEV